MHDNGIRFVHDAKAMLPQSRAVIGVFVVGGFESLIESPETLPRGARSQQKRGRAIVHVAAKHVHGCKGIVASAVSEA